MTREEEIKVASIETFKPCSPPGFSSKFIDINLEQLREAFILGAMWADNHPSIDLYRIGDAEDLNLSIYD